MECVGYLISNYIETSLINGDHKFKSSVVIELNGDHCFIFPYGAVVIWGKTKIEDFLSEISSAIQSIFPVEKWQKDEFEIELKEGNKLIHEDVIYLPEKDIHMMLAMSHSIAQSLRLTQIEDDTARIMEENERIPRDLAQSGKIHFSKKDLSKLQGQLYLKKSEMNFEYTILDKPEFLWEYPEYDAFYVKTCDYLELNQRIDILSKKFSIIDEILSLLGNELNHRHSSRLEWIIIILILIEIIIFFLQDVFKVI